MLNPQPESKFPFAEPPKHKYTQEEVDEAKMKAWEEMAMNGMTRSQRRRARKEAEKAWKKHQDNL